MTSQRGLLTGSLIPPVPEIRRTCVEITAERIELAMQQTFASGVPVWTEPREVIVFWTGALLKDAECWIKQVRIVSDAATNYNSNSA